MHQDRRKKYLRREQLGQMCLRQVLSLAPV
jgi:hypothetical protein